MRERRMEVNARRSCSDQCEACCNQLNSVREVKGSSHLNETQLCFQTQAYPSEQIILREPPRGHTCTIRHAFASSINGLLALLLGRLELTVFTARTVPITAEEEHTVQVNGQLHSSDYGHACHRPREGRAESPEATYSCTDSQVLAPPDTVPLPFLMQTRAAEWSILTHL